MKTIGLILASVLAGNVAFAQTHNKTKKTTPTHSIPKPAGAYYTDTILGVSVTMVKVEGGNFKMGCIKQHNLDCENDERPSHPVTLKSYYIGQTEVTQALWRAVMGGANPSAFQRCEDCPVEGISWDEAKDFLEKLNAKSKHVYRLPTEAEWEFAARGGIQSKQYKFAGSDDLQKVGWFKDNSMGKTHSVGKKAPNEIGLYDMSGNVWEWCGDWHSYYSKDTTTVQENPIGPANGRERIYRSGAWNIPMPRCRTTFRYSRPANERANSMGLRLVADEK